MANEQIEIFVHAQGARPRLVTSEAEATLRDVLRRLEIIKEGADDIQVFVGECEEALFESDDVENGADEHASVDITLTLEKLELGRHRELELGSRRVQQHLPGQRRAP